MFKVKAYAALARNSELVPFSIERREPSPQDVLIRILYCGICHSDVHQVRGDWGEMHPSHFPMVPGHEIIGQVERTGSAVTRHRVGDIVGVGCIVNSCRICTECVQGEEQFCENGITPTYNAFEKDGRTPVQGGYSTHVVVDEAFVLRVPRGLPPAAAAPLLCAGITTYSPLRNWGVTRGTRVGVIGLGGLGHVAVKIASAMGAEVTVLSHSANKRADAARLGARDFRDTSDQQIFKVLARKFDLLLNTISQPLDYDRYMSLLARDGTLVLLGINADGPVCVNPGSLMIGRRKLSGSPIGGIRETQEMLDFCAEHEIAADVELIPIQSVNQAYARMLASDVRYRFVIDMKSLG
jgi:uncharacterized zinc-type alcohol dehydrogenase-like protein